MPSLSNDLIRRLNQIDVIALGCLTGSQGPLKVTWPAWHSNFRRYTERNGERLSPNDGRQQADLCLAAKQTSPQGRAVTLRLIPL